ncbi:copper amine oxidase [Sporosarcina sp. P37]|nr:copper amine oxidase [Sporosarcina sp. P37]
MNKMISFALTALLIGSAAAPAAIYAEGKVKTEVTSDEKAFSKVEGVIEHVVKENDVTRYTIKQKEESPVLAVTDETLIFDNTGKEKKLKKGDKVSAYVYSDKPMILIYPPQYSPDAVIVETDKTGTAAVGRFNDELVDPHLKLRLTVDENTELLTVSGKQVKAGDLKGKDLLVFYTASTKSIPAQTTPEKVVVLDGSTEDEHVTAEQIIENDHYIVDGVKMVPLRLLAEKLGYTVDSTGTGAIVSKGALSYTITRGQKEYGYNKSLMKFEAAPGLLEPWKTYVPIALIEELMK